MPKTFLPFDEARALAQSYQLSSSKDYQQLGSERPDHLPACPHKVYKDQGWRGWGDFLGTGAKRGFRPKTYLPYEEARALVRVLNLPNSLAFFSLGHVNRPEGVPSAPHRVYAESGWINWQDFLGHEQEPHGTTSMQRSFFSAAPIKR